MVVATVLLTTDGVDETHVDDGDPSHITKYWTYTLITDRDGLVVDGSWQQDDEHPDFAWVPYENPRGSSEGANENPFLRYGDILDVFGDDIERR